MESEMLFDGVKPAVLVSMCWRGDRCRYHGRLTPKPQLLARLERRFRLVFVCPERLGGLPVPRPAAPLRLRRDGRLWDVKGREVTHEYMLGAEKTLEIARQNGCERAYLVRGSPACDKSGFAGELLTAHGIRVINYPP